MKKHLLLVAGLLIGVVSFAQNISKYAPQVVLIGIGEKNTSLDEKEYPNLKFYYTPEIKNVNKAGSTGQAIVNLTDVAKFEVTGSPEFLVNLWNDKEMDKAFFLFDKNGVCATQGYDILRRRGDIAICSCIDKKELNDHLVDIVKKDKEAKAAKKEMNIKKSDFMLGQKLPEFNVSDVDGNTVSIQSVLENEPTLVVFFNLPPGVDIHAGEQSFKGESGKKFMKAMVSSTSGASDTNLFDNLQSQFFE